MMDACRLTAFFGGVGIWLLVALAAVAGDKQRAYEQELVERSFETLSMRPDPKPEGKIIEDIIVLRHPIVEKTDPWPDFLNVFHVVTREHIIRQELLFHVGSRFDGERIAESARNLRDFPMVFSIVRIMAASGSSPDRVKVVIITKDLWSIRINSDFNFGGGVLNYLSFMPTEQNFLGYNQQVGLITRFDRDTFYLAQFYQVPRLFGSRLSLVESLGLRTNHRKEEVEGATGSLYLGKPLYSVLSKWAFSVKGSFDLGTERKYRENGIDQVVITDGVQEWPIDYIYDYKSLDAQAVVARSFGLKWKTNVSFGYSIFSRKYSLNKDFPVVPEPVEQAFIDYALPVDDQAGSLVASVSFYEATYRRFMNIQTYGLTEDYRFGPRATLEASWSNRVFGFDQEFVKLYLDLGYQWLLGGNILSLGAALSARWQPDHGLKDASSEWINQVAQFQLYNITPELFGIGRLCTRLLYAYSQYSLSRSLFYLGGNNTLRGFASNYLSGPRLLNVNVEFRSLPLVLYTMHFGFVVFYDGGSAYGFTNANDFAYRQSVGFGIRGLFPQFDRGTVRLDVGVPVGAGFRSDRIIEWFTLAYLQAF